MARKDIGVGLNRDNRNAINHNFIELYKGQSDYSAKLNQVEQNMSDKMDNFIEDTSNAALDKVVDNAKLDWLNPVDSYDKLPKDAKKGNTVMTRDNGYVYRFDGEQWIEIQEIDVGPVNQLEQRFDKELASLDLKKANAQITLDIPSYVPTDDHVVHPYVLDFPTKKYGYQYIMAFTPYSESRDRYENPSIVVSDDRYTWSIPNGLINPIIKQPESGFHYSDPMLLDNGTELEMWYRLTDKSGKLGSKILMVKSRDLISWSTPQTIFDYGQFDTAYISPTGHIENNVYKIWYRNARGKYILVESTDLISWSSPKELVYDYGPYNDMGYSSWHDEIKVIDGKYICVTSTLPSPSPDLFLFESLDGVNFKIIKKIMEPSLSGFDSMRLYKSSIVKHGIWYYIYYSAFARDNSCHIGLTKASGALNFMGMTHADKDYYNKKRFSTTAIYGQNNVAPVAFPTGISVSGDGLIKSLNSGVAGYHTQPTKADTMTVLTDAGTKKGYIDIAGGYLASESNDSIQGIYKDKGAFYLDKTSKGFTVLPDGVNRQRYARMLHFIINAASGKVTIYEGEDFIDEIESVSLGLKINFKNMPSGYVPFANVAIGNPEGLMVGSQSLMYHYVREIGHGHVIIGLKYNHSSSGHIAWNNVTLGLLRVCITY